MKTTPPSFSRTKNDNYDENSSSSAFGLQHWKILYDETDLLLSTPTYGVISNDTLVDILVRWQAHPNVNQAAETSQELLHHWLEHNTNNANKTTLTTSEPFLLVMKAWNRVNNDSNDTDNVNTNTAATATNATAHVMNMWMEHLGGDIELSPDRNAYHVLLESFATTTNHRHDEAEDAEKGVEVCCLDVLHYMERMKSISGNLTLQPPNVETYAHVITSLTNTSGRRRNDDDSSLSFNSNWETIQSVMDKLNNVHRMDEPQDVYFRLQAHCQVVNYAVSIGKDMEAMTMMDEILLASSDDPTVRDERKLIVTVADEYWKEQCRRHHAETNRRPSPTLLVGSAFQSLFSSVDFRHGQEASQMNMLQTRLEEVAPFDSGLPWPQHYAMTIQLLCNASIGKDVRTLLKTASRCEELLQHMEDRHLASGSSSVETRLTLRAYEQVIRMYSLARQPNERLLSNIMKLLEDHSDTVEIDRGTLTTAWNNVLNAYCETANYDKATELWERMEAMGVPPNNFTFQLVLTALSCVRRSDAAPQAERILRTMKGTYGLTSAHYEAVIVAWTRSSQESALSSAQALLEELEQLYDAADRGQNELRPTVNAYNAVILTLARIPDTPAAQQILERMVERAKNDRDCPLPNTFTFNVILDGLSRERCSIAASEAECFLETMESCENAQPDRRSYTSVMSAIARSGDKDAPERVMSLYERMLAASKARDDDHSLRPDVVTFGLLLDTWAQSRRRDAGEHAEQLLRIMQANGISANVVNYNNVILAHARSKQYSSFNKAEVLLREMEERYAAGDESVKPNTVTYTNIIQTLKRSIVQEKPQVACNILQEMSRACADGNTDVRPNVITLNAVLTACAFTKGDEDSRSRAVKVALSVFSEMDKLEVVPNGNTYRILIETFGRQVSDMSERSKMAEIAFHRCHREGRVDASVVNALQKFVPQLFQKIASSLPSSNARDTTTRRAIQSKREQ